MRQVKCRDTGMLVSASDAWKAPDGKYYSSQGAFKHLENEKMYRQKCIDEIGDILGYIKGQKFPTIVAKKIKEYEVYGYDTVLRTILDKKQTILYNLCNKTFASEYNKVSYIMAIITNSINDVYKRKKAEEKDTRIDESVVTMEEVETINSPVNTSNIHDISKFLV